MPTFLTSIPIMVSCSLRRCQAYKLILTTVLITSGSGRWACPRSWFPDLNVFTKLYRCDTVSGTATIATDRWNQPDRHSNALTCRMPPPLPG